MPRIVDHHERRREITYAVWHLIATRGFDAVSLRNVAAEAGISVGRIQHYFPSKEGMIRHGCIALVDQADQLFTQRTEDLPPKGALRDLLTHAVPHTHQLALGTTVWYAYLARSVEDPQIAEILRRAQLGAEEEATRLLRALRQAPAGDAARGTARRLLAIADGLAVRVLTGQLAADDAVALIDEELDRL